MLFCPRLIKTSRRGKIIGREVASARCIETKSNAWKTKHQVLWWLLMCHYYVRKCYLHHLGKPLSLKRVISDLLLNIAKLCLECCGRPLFVDSQKCSMSMLCFLQGDPNQKLQFQMAVTLEKCLFDPPLVKPKCVSGVEEFFIVNKQLKTKKIRLSSNPFWFLQHIV